MRSQFHNHTVYHTIQSPYRNSRPSTESGESVVLRSSKVRPASENERPLDVLVAGTPRSTRASVASPGSTTWAKQYNIQNKTMNNQL